MYIYIYINMIVFSHPSAVQFQNAALSGSASRQGGSPQWYRIAPPGGSLYLAEGP